MCLLGVQGYVPVWVCRFMCLLVYAGVCTSCGVPVWVCRLMCLLEYAHCWCVYLLGCTRSRACFGVQVHVPVVYAGVCTCWGVQGHVSVWVCRFMCQLVYAGVCTCWDVQGHVSVWVRRFMCLLVYVPVGVDTVMCLFACAGSTDGKVHSWSTETGAKIAILSSDHPGPIQNMQFNPKYMMMATACTNMVSCTAPILPPSTAEHECQPQYMVTYDVYNQMMGHCSGHFAAQTQKHDDVYSLC